MYLGCACALVLTGVVLWFEFPYLLLVFTGYALIGEVSFLIVDTRPRVLTPTHLYIHRHL